MYPTSNVDNSAHPSCSPSDSLEMLIGAHIAMHHQQQQQALQNLMSSQPFYNGCPQGVANRQPMMSSMSGLGHPMMHASCNNGAHNAPANVENSKTSVHKPQSATTTSQSTNYQQPIPVNLQVPILPPVTFYCAPTLSQSINGQQRQVERAQNQPHDLAGVKSSKAFVSMMDLRQRVLEALQESKASELKEHEDILSANSSFSVVSDSHALEGMPIKTQEFVRAVQKSRLAKTCSKTSSDVQKTSEVQNSSAQNAPLLSGIDSASIQKHFEQQLSLQKQILELLQPKSSDYFARLAEPMSYRIAVDRLKALKPEEPSAPETPRKNASMVFIYDVEDITQLSLKIMRGVRRLFPDVKNVSRAIESVFSLFTSKFFEFSEDFDFETVMNIKDGHFGTKKNEYLEFKNKCETSGPNVIYELIKVREDENKAREDAFKAQLGPNKASDTMLKALGMSKQKVDLHQVVEFQKLFDQVWQTSKRCLQAISDKSLKNTYDNVVLCEMLGYGSAQLLLSGLASEVPLENLYSKRRSSDEKILERIQRDYGDDCLLVVVTSNAKTVAAAEKKNILVWPVDSADSLDALYAAQQSHLLK